MFAANDGLAQSTINAVEAAGFGPIPVSGQDATAEGMQNVALGIQTVSVYKPIQDEAGVTAAIALALRNGEDYESAATGYTSSSRRGVRRSRSSASTPPTARRPTRPRATASFPTSPWSRSA